MSKSIIRIHNVQTNEVIDRKMNEVEYANYQADLAQQNDEKLLAEAKATAKADLLARLGITEDEARLLLG